MVKKFKLLILFIVFLNTFNSFIYSEDWSDLDDNNISFYGSEKEAKYPINAFFIEKEKWKNHDSFHLFWLYKTVNYPKYKSFRLLPFWYHLSSKLDDRSRWSIPLFMIYSRHSQNSDLFISPFYYSNLEHQKKYFYSYHSKNKICNKLSNSKFYNPKASEIEDAKQCKYYMSIDEDRSLFYVIWWGKNEGSFRLSKYFLFLPFLLKRQSIPTLQRTHEYTNFYSFFFMSFYDKYYYKDDSKNIKDYDTKNRQLKSSKLLFWAPIIPLVYLNLTPDRHRVNVFWLLDYDRRYNRIYAKRPADAPRISENDLYDNGYFYRFWFTPFYYYKRGDKGYHFILPPIYIENRNVSYNNDKKFYRHLLPFFIYNNDTLTKYKYNYKEKFSSKYTINKKTLINLLWFSSETKELSVETTKIVEEKVLISPENTSAENKKQDIANKNKEIIKPTLKYKIIKKKIVQEKKTNRFLEKTFWVPILPLYYSSYDYQKGWHKNLLWFMNWQKDIQNNLKQLWVFPLLYYFNDVSKTSSSKTHLNWLFYYNKNKKNNLADVTLANILFYSYKKNQTVTVGKNKKENIKQSTFWVPIIPLYYSSYDYQKGWHKNLFWLINWKKGINNNLKQLSLAPLFYYSKNININKFSKNKNKIIKRNHINWLFYSTSTYSNQPLKSKYLTENKKIISLNDLDNKSSKQQEYKVSSTFWVPIIPLYYSSYDYKKGYHKNILGFIDWTSNEHEIKRLLIIPLVYWDFSSTGMKAIFPFYIRWPESTKEKGLSFGLFHYHNWAKNKTRYWFLPVRYYAENKIKKTYTSLWFPVYFHKMTQHWELSLNPLFFEYHNKKTDKKYRIYPWGWSRTIAQGGTQISFDIGKNKKGYYIETEGSWFYDIFSIAFKTTFYENRTEVIEPGAKLVMIEDKEDVAFSSKKDITTEATRQNAINYFHIKFLFGLWEFQILDSEKHFRLLPLTWITWNKHSSNKMFWMLNTLYYNAPKTKNKPSQSYFVFFPLFARQTIGQSYFENYGLIFFMREYFKINNHHEYTFLWPLINFYSSNISKGSRFLPFYWYKGNYNIDKKTHQKLTYESRLITPLYYNKDVWDVKSNQLQSRFSISLSHFNSFHREVSKERDYSTQTIGIPIIPIYYKQETTKTYSFNNKIETYKDNLSFLLPVYLSMNESSYKANEIIERSAFFTLPGFAFFKTKKTTIDPITKEKKVSINSSKWFWFYNRKSSGTSSHSSFLFGLYSHETNSPNYSNWKALYGLIGSNSSSYKRVSLLKKPGADISTTQKTVTTQTNFSFWMAPLFYYSNSLLKKNNETNKQAIRHVNLLLYYRNKVTESTKNIKDYTIWFPILPLFYHSENKYSTHTNLFWFIDWGNSKTNKYEKHFMIAPLYFSWQYSKDETNKIVFGLYLTQKKKYTYWNFLFLANYENNQRQNTIYDDSYKKFGLLFNSFYFKIEKDYTKFEFLYGLGVDYHNFKNNQNYSFSLLTVLYNIKQYKNDFSHSLLGLYHYKSTKNSYSLIMPALLSYINKTPTSKTQVIGLGLIWFQYENYVDKTDYEYLLLGIPYYKKTKPERGYVSYGSLWGLLWEYEKETETDYTKFSLLKFLYKRVHHQGKTTTRVLGIAF